ncbi:Acylphosphatase [archaeon HR01]|nr:Acylphosphatase [archaeon HR01]
MAVKAARIRVYGLVQGVFFRAHMKSVAEELGLVGWVRNLEDGSVEAYAEGDEAALRKLVEWCHRGPPAARVERVDVEWSSPQGELTGFIIRWS